MIMQACNHRLPLVCALVIFAASVASGQVNVYTQRGDTARDGQYSNEVYLNATNVNSATFGSLFSYSVDGQVAAQPLYVSNVNIPGSGVVNVVYVATEHDSVYAFNADTFGTGAPLWQVNFLNPGAGVTTEPIADQGCPNVTGYTESGITGTPVIDPATNTLYVVAKTKEVANNVTSYIFRLHALDITTGQEKFGAPVQITASLQVGQNQVTLNTQKDLQRPALLLLNGTLFVGFGSNGCDQLAHGWLLAYDATSLQQLALINTSPAKTYGSSLWMGGIGPAADSSGNVYLATANGIFDVNTGGSDYGDTVMKLSLNGTSLSVADYFTPFNQANLAQNDLDLGSGGVVLLPDQSGPFPHLLVVAGKTGTIYLINRDNMGHYNPAGDTQIVQELPGAVGPIFGAPIYWNNAVYFAGRGDLIKAFSLTSGLLSVSPIAQSPSNYTFQGVPVLSANGNSNGLLWLVRNLSSGNPTPLMSAFDGTTLAELYTTNQNSGRDALGSAPHFATPLIANGKVYVGTQTQLKAYGLFPVLSPSAGNNQTATVNTTISLSVLATNAYTGAGIPGVPVAFSDGGKGGSFNPATAITNSTGTATTVYTLPKTPNTITISATSNGYAKAAFTETAVSGPPATLTRIAGSGQTGTVATTLPSALQVKLTDAYGNPLGNFAVTFSDNLSGGGFSSNPVNTNANGQAGAYYTLPTKALPSIAITATYNTLSASFTEKSVAGAPASLNLVSGNNQSALHGTALPRALVVSVKDQYNNPVPQITIAFADGGVGGTFSTTNPTTNSGGQASVTYVLPSQPQTVHITATLNSFVVNFTETAK